MRVATGVIFVMGVIFNSNSIALNHSVLYEDEDVSQKNKDVFSA